MNKKTMKAAGIATVILGLAVLPAAAQNFKGNRGSSSNQQRMEYNDKPNKMPLMKNGGMQEPDLIGTVSKVDEEKQMVTVRDVDGTDHVVHVSDFTRIRTVDLTADIPARGDRPNERPPLETIKDIKKDSSVAITYFDTDTKTVEAKRIIVMKK